ncbi:MAG TPA: RNA methyltransferase [Vulgatibacter sp.]
MNPLFLATPPGLESVCAEEAPALGLKSVRAVPGGVEGEGDLAAVLRANLASRIASRVVLRLGEGATSEAAAIARAIDWRAFVPEGGNIELEIAGGGRDPSRFERAIRGAIQGAVPYAAVATGGAAVQSIRVRIAGGRIHVGVDSSGAHLHQRGYRQETGAAPLRENLAAGILRLAGYDGSQPLLDPMCGSGTFVIEAALMALGRGPGMGRSFACESWPSMPAGLPASVRASLREAERERPAGAVLGSDRNAGALGVARRNATRAGVFSAITLVRRDVADLEAPAPGPGVVVVNPPYGRRVGEAGELAGLYRTLGERLRSEFAGWTCAVLVADRSLGARLRLPSPVETHLRNGGIPCVLLVSSL